MSFRKFLFKNGFGSIGSAAKIWSTNYLESINSGATKDQAKIHLISSYSLANKKFRSYNSTDPSLLHLKSDNCIAYLIWMLICDIPSNLSALLINEEGLQDATEAVYESVVKIIPHDVINNDYEFYKKAKEYVYYRDNVFKALESNKQVYNPSYRIIIVCKGGRGVINNYDIELYSDAKEEYLKSISDYNPEDYLVELIEMNDNKYVYMHDSTDKTVQLNLNKSSKIFKGKLQIPGIDYYE